MSVDEFEWLPDHQLHVAATLAHADHLIERVTEALRPTLRDGAVELEDRYEDGLCFATVKSVKPLPPAVALFTADALTQLRAAIEHVLFAEVERRVGRTITEREARSIEMPAFTDADKFASWITEGRRRTLAPFREGSLLVRRMRELQPYNNRKRPDDHPLRLLAEHTNLAKHRTPVVAATHVARIVPLATPPGVVIPPASGQPVKVGDVVAIAPAGTVLPMDVWPTVTIQRPHTGERPVLVKELAYVADWVRTVAIPMLIIGRHNVTPLPSQLDTSRGWGDLRAALVDAGTTTAAERFARSIRLVIAREGLRDIVAEHDPRPPRSEVSAWITSLQDEEVFARVKALKPGQTGAEILRTARVVDGWAHDLAAFTKASKTPIHPAMGARS
ncbi:hypothetical protein [Pengzhenrongella frigida]|uniref:Uncharacterized protein n=1 Tax=Pengzhenrongella frigida TaxID=1259133 RepID=A0A4Q5MZ74_9MICO|nr:hypothetical protein [Cellulomonas sp. HLT2-17]RYV51010.1 hypothetical protein EUA98_10910 [Cellulomonas sp. HLT2-17]